MASNTNNKQRIRLVCAELENALQDFENESQADAPAHAEGQNSKIKELKKTLTDIKKQLEELSE